MHSIKRRHFFQLAGSTLTVLGLEQLTIRVKGDRYGRVRAQSTTISLRESTKKFNTTGSVISVRKLAQKVGVNPTISVRMLLQKLAATGPLHDVPAPSSILHIHKDVTFRSGVAIGGWYDVALTPQGDISFSGHLHNSGADNYNTTVAVVLMTPDGLAYSVTHQGNTYGTFHTGSRNDDWVINEKNDIIAKNWDTQFSKATWKSTARASSKTLESIQSIVDDLANQLAQAAGKAAVEAVISLVK